MPIQTQAEGFGCTWEIREGQPGAVLVNDPEETRRAAQIVREAFGDQDVSEDGPTYLGSEDFAFMLLKRRGAYIGIGADEEGRDNPPVHNPYYDFNDNILPLGAAYWVELVKQQLPAA